MFASTKWWGKKWLKWSKNGQKFSYNLLVKSVKKLPSYLLSIKLLKSGSLDQNKQTNKTKMDSYQITKLNIRGSPVEGDIAGYRGSLACTNFGPQKNSCKPNSC